ncbi:MAG: hypothetical protein WCT27_04520 [Patescibacteria group bacterium]|jgi:hypothetical protein
MNKRIIIGLLLIGLSVAGIIYIQSLYLETAYCGTCPSVGTTLGSGIRSLIEEHKVCVPCDLCGCVMSYTVIPVDFYIISILPGLVGLWLLIKNRKTVLAEPQNTK